MLSFSECRLLISRRPGTGKTVTIIEAIRQILLKDPEARILACAPSNSATDLIAERLEVLGPSQLFRMNAPSRAQSTLPKVLGQFSRKNDYGTFLIPPKAELMKFRVVVSTCISACVPYNIGVPRGHFTHIFVDEAGQAAEPEAMIPIKTMSDGRTNIILSGDPKQLGPIVRSDLALTLKLGVSYLDRLCETQTYNESQMNGITYVAVFSLSHVILNCIQGRQVAQELPFAQTYPVLPQREVLQRRTRTVCRPSHYTVVYTMERTPNAWCPNDLSRNARKG